MLHSFASVVVMAALAVAGIEKLRNIRGFETTISNFRIVPSAVEGPTARTVVAAELALATLVLVPRSRRVALLLATALFAMFALVIARAMLQGNNLFDCGCFGSKDAVNLNWSTFARASALGAIALSAGLLPPSSVYLAVDALSAIVVLTLAGFVTVLRDFTKPARSHETHYAGVGLSHE